MRVCLAQAEAVEWLRMSRRPAVDWHEEKNPKWSSTASEQVDCCCCQRTLPSPQSHLSHSSSSSSASSQSWWSQRHLPRKKQQGHSHLLSLRTSLASNSRHRYIRCIATRTRGPTLRDTALHRSSSPLPSQNETTTMQRIPTEHVCDTNLVRSWRELSLYTYICRSCSSRELYSRYVALPTPKRPSTSALPFASHFNHFNPRRTVPSRC